MYPLELLKDVDLETCSATFNPKITMENPGEGLKVRPLSKQVRVKLIFCLSTGQRIRIRDFFSFTFMIRILMILIDRI